MTARLVSFVIPCFNEEGNVEEVLRQIDEIMRGYPRYRCEFVFIDNASADGTPGVLRRLAARDPRVRVIFNSRNFGVQRSHFHAFFKTRGDAVVTIMSDLQDPPALIRDFLERWEAGSRIVVGQIKGRKEHLLMRSVRNFYYRVLGQLSNIKLISGFTGFSLVDRQVVEVLRRIHEPNPNFRGLIAEVGFDVAIVPYVQQKRLRGRSSTNLYYLYDLAMLGITNYSKVPLRLATMTGFLSAGVSLLISLGYLAYKLIYWQSFTMGVAPVVIGLFFFASLQLIFLGIVGEYIGAIHTNVLNRPLVVERETLNFDREEP